MFVNTVLSKRILLLPKDCATIQIFLNETILVITRFLQNIVLVRSNDLATYSVILHVDTTYHKEWPVGKQNCNQFYIIIIIIFCYSDVGKIQACVQNDL